MNVCGIILVTIATAFVVQGGVIYETDIEIDEQHWGKWFDTDNPTGGGIGEDERINHIIKRYGTKCRHSVQCSKPLAMEVDLAFKHVRQYPEADLNEVLSCINLRPNATDPSVGFYCVQADQTDPSDYCLSLCEKNGLVNEFVPYPNCMRCPDVMVRYYCPEGVEKTCIDE